MIRRAATELVDVEDVIAQCGISNLTEFTPANDVRVALETLAVAATAFDDITRAQVKARAKDALIACKVLGGTAAVNAAFRSTRRPQARSDAPLLTPFEELPENVLPNTDLANAHRLVRDHGNDLRHVPELGWLVWDGKRWAGDDSAEVLRRAHRVTCELEALAATLLADASRLAASRQMALAEHRSSEAKAMLAWAKSSQNEKRIAACIAVAEPLLAARAEDFDRDPWVLNCANGTVDLRTGVLREHAREDNITCCCAAEFDAEADTPTWRGMLDRILPDPEIQLFVQRYAGYSLTGSTDEQCFVICHGAGANGKSTVLETLRHVLRDYAANAGTDTFMQRRGERGSDHDVARLRAARFVTAIESGENRTLDEERVKRLTGGDTMTARFLYKEHFEFKPRFKLWLAANDRPHIRGVDHGIWRRVLLVPFDVGIPAHEQDRSLARKLQDEAPGILRWLVDGCRSWLGSGLRPPEAIVIATREWRGELNTVKQFVDECCVRVPSAKIRTSTLYHAFKKWAETEGEEVLRPNHLGARLRALGFTPARGNAGRFWLGVGLVADPSP